MAQNWFQRQKSKLRERSHRSGSPHQTPAAPPAPATSPPPVTSSPPTTSPAPATPDAVSHTSSAPCQPTTTDIKKQLWNQAYDELKSTEVDLVEAYEKFLSAELQKDDSTLKLAALTTTIDNQISQDVQQRWRQMEQLVKVGLHRTEKSAATKQKINNEIQHILPVKELIGKAVQASPEAALAWVGISFSLEMLVNPLTEPNLNREGVAYIVSRMSWYWDLTDLLLDGELIKPALEALQSQLKVGLIKLYQKLILYQMKSVCLYHRGRFATFFKDLIQMDDWASLLEEIKAAEDTLQNDINRFGSEKTLSHLQDQIRNGDSLNKEMQSFRSAAEHYFSTQEDKRHDDKYEECLNAIYETDPRDEKFLIEEAKGGLLWDSFSWILDHDDFQKWRKESDQRLLWIRGDPGKGKTMLMCGIVDELQKDTNHLCYFFCQATENSLNNATAVLRGLIYSLVSQHSGLMSYVAKEYKNGGQAGRFKGQNAWAVMSTILKGILHDPASEKIVLVIDALDECEVDRRQLLDFIVNMTSSSKAKWIVSSRNWPVIEDRLSQSSHNNSLRLELNETSVSAAVQNYIGHKVAELAQLKKYDAATKEHVRRKFIEKADNTFLWVALVYRELAKDDVRLWHTLETLDTFPAGLNDLYERMMQHIRFSRDAKSCKDVLAVAATAYRPLSLAELTVIVESLALFQNRSDVVELISSCGSFLTLRKGNVYFVHQSAKDFLLKQVPQEIMPFGIAHQHSVIFLRSLKVLSEILKRDIYKLYDPGYLAEDIRPPSPDPLCSAVYSCIHWVDHLDSSCSERDPTSVDGQNSDVVYNFLCQKLLYWIEALSCLRNVSVAVLALQKLENLVQISARDSQLAKLVHDAHRFILSHRVAVELAPLQVYASALLFSPTYSIVRELFQYEEPTWVLAKPAVQANWDACLQTLEGHTDSVYSVVSCADGQQLASASADGTVKIWDALTGECLQTLETQNSGLDQPYQNYGSYRALNSVASSADNKLLAAGSTGGHVTIWRATNGAGVQTLYEVLAKLEASDGGSTSAYGGSSNELVRSVAFSPNGQQLALGTKTGTVSIWDLTSRRCVQILREHDNDVWCVAFSPGGDLLASASSDGTVKVWNLAESCSSSTLYEHDKSPRSVAFAADEEWIASAGGSIKIWDVQTGNCLLTINENFVFSISISPDSRRLASDSNRVIKIWDTLTGSCLRVLQGHGNFIKTLIFAFDGEKVVSASSDRTIKIWDVKEDKSIPGPTSGRNRSADLVVLSEDYQQFAAAFSDHTIEVWETTSGKCIQTLRGHTIKISDMAFSFTHERLITCSRDKTVKVWDLLTGTCLKDLIGHSSFVTSVAFSPDSLWFASSSWDKSLRVWDAVTYKPRAVITDQEEGLSPVTFSADSKLILSGSTDGTIKSWDIETGTCTRAFRGHTDRVMSLVTSQDGRWIASSNYWDGLRIWNLETGCCVQRFTIEGSFPRLSFQMDPKPSLQTQFGLVDLDLNNTQDAQLDAEKAVCFKGYGFSTDFTWIVQDGKRLLWLPLEYRPSRKQCIQVTNNTLVWGCGSGKVVRIMV